MTEPVIRRLTDADIGPCLRCGVVFSEHIAWHSGAPPHPGFLDEHSVAEFAVAVTGIYCP